MKPVELPLLSELFYPAFKAALPLRILSRPPTGIGWWSDFWFFFPAPISSAQQNGRCADNRRGGAVRRPGLRSFSDLRAARRTAPTGCSSIYTVGAVFNRPHWRMTCAPDKTVGLYRRAIDNRPYGKTPFPAPTLSLIHYQLSITPPRMPPAGNFLAPPRKSPKKRLKGRR